MPGFRSAPAKLTTAFGEYPFDVATAIFRWCDSMGYPKFLIMPMLIHESGGFLNPTVERHTADEDSYGICQVNMRAGWPGKGEDYLGLDGCMRAMTMLETARWRRVWIDKGGWRGWIKRPTSFLDEFAPLAQGSDGWWDDRITGEHTLAEQRFGEGLLLHEVWWPFTIPDPNPVPLNDEWMLRVGIAKLVLSDIPNDEMGRQLHDILSRV